MDIFDGSIHIQQDLPSDIRYLDLFSGIGGFHQAANQLPHEKFTLRNVAYCEVDEAARRVYNRAFFEKKCSQCITDAKDIQTKHNQGVVVTDFDLLFAGFPCQAFSNVGYRKGLKDDRGKLFFRILDILDYYQPSYFILENVQKLSTIEKGDLLYKMQCALEQAGAGYHLHTWDLLASNYGLPQKRKRVFFCGIRQDLADKQMLPPPNRVILNNTKYPTAWHLLEKSVVDIKHYIPAKTRKTVLYKNIKWEGDVLIDNPIARPLTASMSKWHRANQDNYYSDTYIFNNEPYIRPIVDLDKEKIRRITPLEGLRLQGFPDRYAEYISDLPYAAQYRLIGNAVPVNLAQAVIEHFLRSYYS